MACARIGVVARAIALVVSLVAVSGTAQAAGWSILGGRTLDPRNSAIRVSAGWPDVHVAYHLPITADLELAPKFGLLYGFPAFGVAGSPTFIGNSIGGELRWRLLSRGDFHLAAKAELGLNLYYSLYDEFYAGMRLSPGVVADYEVSSAVNLTTGFEIPFEFIFTDPFSALIPILFAVGLEFEAKENLLFFVNMKLGPAVVTVDGESDTGFGFDGRLGLAYRF